MYEYLYEFMDRKIHFRGRRPYVGTRLIASAGRQSYCDFNTICFWRKFVVSLQQQTGQTAQVRPVFVEKGPFHRVFLPWERKNYMACSFSRMPCRKKRKPCTKNFLLPKEKYRGLSRRQMCTKVKNVKVGRRRMRVQADATGLCAGAPRGMIKGSPLSGLPRLSWFYPAG